MKMKTVLLFFATISINTAFADAPNWAEQRCGATQTLHVETVATDFSGQYYTNGPLRAITLVAAKKKTNILRVLGFQPQTRSWSEDFSWQFRRQAQCEGVPGRICDGQSVTVCVRGPVSSVSFQTEGSNSGRLEIRYAY